MQPEMVALVHITKSSCTDLESSMFMKKYINKFVAVVDLGNRATGAHCPLRANSDPIDLPSLYHIATLPPQSRHLFHPPC